MSAIREETTCDDAHVAINGCDSLVRAGLEQFRANNLFNSKDNALLAANTNACSSIFDSLHGVLDLEVAAIRGED